MVWASVTTCGLKTPLFFIEQGVKVNQNVYLTILKDLVIHWAERNLGDSGVTLQQDGATSHTAKLVQSFCKDNFKGFWSKDLWPPSLPDLNPMDFGVWSLLEKKAGVVSHKNTDSLKRALLKCWEEIDPETLRPTCAQVPTRLGRVIRAKGGYF